MNIQIEKRTAGADEVNLISLRNSAGFEIALTDFGAAIYYIAYPDKTGVSKKVTNCPKDFDTFVHSTAFYGKIVGRVAGRLKDGEAIVNGKVYPLYKNEGKNTLHSGKETFGFKRYSYEIRSTEKKTEVIFKIKSPDGEGGFPGNVTAKIIYTIPEKKKEVTIRFTGKCDAPTLLNLTSHVYINLNGGVAPIYDQELYLRSSQVSVLDSGLIIEGFEPVPEYLDFTQPAKLGLKIRHPALLHHASCGMDHVFLFDGIDKNIPSAILYDPLNKRKMTLYTDYPAVVCYAGNHPSEKENLSGTIDGENFAITFETVIPTDRPEPITFSPERPYHFFAKYKFN